MINSFNYLMKWINFPILKIGVSAITLGGIFIAVFIFLITVFLSSLAQKMLNNKLGKYLKLSPGLNYALQRMLHYAFIFIGIIIALQSLGFNLSSLTVAFGFIGVGIGFGLQNLTSNFISGIILLMERPVASGDFITIEEKFGEVRSVNMRATEIRTIDNVTIIVPNAKFIENPVTNWSHGDPKIRIHCPVGVAYGSDVPLIRETLVKVADRHPDVLKKPEPEVRFLEFGSSSLDFDLLVWINDPQKQFLIRSQINYEIDKEFREAEIRIPFPQHDIHIQPGPAVEMLSGKPVQK
ncbi:MAG: mechanosensitive ion channel domain-containing protein [Elusimicrobiota bacterium]